MAKIKSLLSLVCCLLITESVSSQIKVVPLASSGSGYESIRAAGLDYEDPDCIHNTFGSHITLGIDSLLKKSVFTFHSHPKEDNDRCETFDRVRMEIKGGPGTNAEAQHPLNSKSYYRWKFFVPNNYVGSSDFNHIFQNKIFGGDDTSLPLITFTLRANVLQVIHSGGGTGPSKGVLSQTDLSLIRGRWIEAYVYQEHSLTGKIEIILTVMQSKKIVLNYKNDNLLLWRNGAQFSRPKWGIYRLKNNIIKDEILLFSDFCISETSATFCPAEVVGTIDSSTAIVSKFFPEDKASNVITTPTLQWENKDNVVYSVFFGESPTNLPKLATSSSNFYKPNRLAINKTYYWLVESTADNGATSRSKVLSFTVGDSTKIKENKWLVYAGNNLPHLESTPWMELNAKPTMVQKDTVFTDPLLPKNKLYMFHYTGSENFRYRYRNPATDTAITIVFRTKAINKDIKTIGYMEIRNTKWREKMRLNTTSVKIERSVTDIEKNWPRDPSEDFHVIRMTMKGQICKVYLDENPEPFLVGKTETADVNSYIEWGKSATQEVGGIIDYIAIYQNIESGPNEFPTLPDSLVLSNEARLSDLKINGNTIDKFSSDGLSYNINITPDDPVLNVSATPMSRFASVSIVQPINQNDSSIVIDVVANDKISKRKYIVKVKRITTSIKEINFDNINIYPNPSSSIFNIDAIDGFEGQITIHDNLGKVIGRKHFKDNTQIDLSSLPNGLYFLRFSSNNLPSYSKTIIKK
jgi:hypothetical protein